MVYDILITNGLIVDGTGRAAFPGNVAVQDGRIAALGDVSGEAKRMIDAGGKVIAPGFIDAHSHYDAQLFWDTTIDPATSHGITTVLVGNCGFTLAPVRPRDHDYLLGLFSATEEVPKNVLVEQVPVKWESFEEYLAYVEKTPLGVNVLTQVGHSALRYYVMGADSLKRAASAAEIAQMVALAEQAMDAGAAGVSTSFSPHHVDESGGHIPSFYAEDDETLALADAVRRKNKPIFSVNPKGKREGLLDADKSLLSRLAVTSGATVSWNDFGTGSPNWQSALEFMENEIEHGRKVMVVARCQPAETRFALKQLSPLYSGSKPWLEFCGLADDAKLVALADPAWRERLAEYWHKFPYLKLASVEKVVSAKYKSCEGRNLVEVAKERGEEPVALMFDIALEDRLETWFLLQEESKEDESVAERILTSPATLIGISDGGAHLQTFAGADFPTYFLKHWVREKNTFTLEKGVAALTADAAAFIGLTDRGTLEAGKAADIVVFDPQTIAPGELESLDFPGGGQRLRKRASGIDYVIVNGVPIVEAGAVTKSVPGQLLRA